MQSWGEGNPPTIMPGIHISVPCSFLFRWFIVLNTVSETKKINENTQSLITTVLSRARVVRESTIRGCSLSFGGVSRCVDLRLGSGGS